LHEIVYGTYKSQCKEYHLNKLRELLLPSVQLVSFDAKAAYVCGVVRAGLEVSGTPLSLADLQVASIALAHNLILITGNTKHFNRITDLHVENWL
jgi:tRNA(fMet)-specific endonuclease VapC